MGTEPATHTKEDSAMLCSLDTRVGESALKAINDLEKDLGKTLLAFRCHSLKPSSLNADQLVKLQAVENRLGVSLVAVDA